MEFFLSKLNEANCLDEFKLYALVKNHKEELKNPMRTNNVHGASFLCYKNGIISLIKFETEENKTILFQTQREDILRIFYRPDILTLGISALLTIKSKTSGKLVLEVLGKENRRACKEMIKKLK